MNLTEAEWSVMECLWDNRSLTGREATELMEDKMGWSRSTTLTLIRRMEAKGAVEGVKTAGVKAFRPLIRREDAALEETENFLDRVYKGSLSLMVSAFTKKQKLSQEEINELHSILNALGEDNNA